MDIKNTSLDLRIAGRVRTLRSARGLSLQALASRTGVSRSMISLIERGESSATAVLLERLAAGLSVPLASLFIDADAAPSPVSRSGAHLPWKDPQSGYIRRNISPPQYSSPIQIVDVRLPAGAQVAYETGGRLVSVDQQIWVQRGELELSIGTLIHRLRADDCIAMRLTEPVSFRNRTRKSVHYVVVICSEAGVV